MYTMNIFWYMNLLILFLKQLKKQIQDDTIDNTIQ